MSDIDDSDLILLLFLFYYSVLCTIVSLGPDRVQHMRA